MNLLDAGIVLRPRSLAESLDLGLLWCVRVGRGSYLRLAAVLLAPPAVGCWLLHVLAGWQWPLVWLVALALASLLQTPFTIAAGTMMFERDLTARAILRRCARRLHVMVLVWIASQLWVALGLALAVVGAAWTWPQVVYAREAAMLEALGVRAALARARGFVARQVGDTILLLFAQAPVVALFVLCAEQIDEALFGFLLQVGRPFGELSEGGSLFALLGLFAAVPYLATVRFLRYVDGRTRRDGWDLQLTFLALRVADDAGQPKVAS